MGILPDYSRPYGSAERPDEPFAPPTSDFWRRGLLTSQSVYDSDGNLVSGTSTRYAFGEPKAKIKCLVPYTPLQWRFFYYWISEPVYVSKTTTYGSKYSLASETEFTYDTNRMLPTKERHDRCCRKYL